MKNTVKHYREQMGLSQLELGRRVGVSRQTINSLETERYNPSIILAYKIARVFQQHVEDVFIYEENEDE